MGLFDDVIFEMKCPKCNEEVDGFQTKDGACALHTINFWEVNNFYAPCFHCDAWIEFTIKHRERPNRKLTIKDYNMVIEGGRRKKKEAQKK